MREILFRGKRVDNGEWAYGSLQVRYGWRTIEGKRQKDYLISNLNDERNNVVATTVGQYTGLTDKNGKKIFEWDIVKCFYADGLIEIGLIGWSDIDIRFKFASPDGSAYGIDVTDTFEVIGNIHDNPELLKGGAENG